jgi:hypothetical protein
MNNEPCFGRARPTVVAGENSFPGSGHGARLRRCEETQRHAQRTLPRVEPYWLARWDLNQNSAQAPGWKGN